MSLQGAVIAFDLDGTLVDTAPDLIGALNELLADEGLAPKPLASARHLVGRGARALIERAFAEAGRPLDEARTQALLDRYIAVYLGRIAHESAPFEGVEPALDALAGAGARLAVCTNKPTELSNALLEALGLAPRFAAIIGPSEGMLKPDPRMLQLAVEQAGGRIGRSLLVGDSMVDHATARAARAPVVGVTFGYVETPLAAEDFDALIDAYAELPDVVRRLLGG
jgi:phosphoglycolate phosphatase